MMMRIIGIILLVLISYSVKAKVEYPFPRVTEVFLWKNGAENYVSGELSVTNPGDNPWLVQTWAEDENNRRYNIVYPSIFRLEPFITHKLNIYPEKTHKENDIKWILVTFLPATKGNKNNKLIIPVTYRLKVKYSDNK